MTERAGGFLARRELRQASRELTQQIVLGLGLGFLLLCVGAYKYYISPDAWDGLWRIAMWAGALSITLTLVAPLAWRRAEFALRAVGNFVGHAVMSAILVAAYFSLIWPVGALLRALRGTHPLYQWGSQPSATMEGWHDKKLPFDLATAADGAAGQRRGRTGVWKVLVFFARRGYLIFVPLLIVAISLGIALFFLQTSALAPFIYTLF